MLGRVVGRDQSGWRGLDRIAARAASYRGDRACPSVERVARPAGQLGVRKEKLDAAHAPRATAGSIDDEPAHARPIRKTLRSVSRGGGAEAGRSADRVAAEADRSEERRVGQEWEG